MSRGSVDNRSPFAVDLFHGFDEQGRPIAAPIVKGSFDVSALGEWTLAEQQAPVNFAGELYGEPGKSGYRHEPDAVAFKPSTDVVLIGTAQPPGRGATAMGVSFQVGRMAQRAVVTGERVVESGLLGVKIGAPRALQPTPLLWENAFGGWDRTPEDETRHGFESRNPVGCGFVAGRGKPVEGSRLPSIEGPDARLKRPGGKCEPVGFGFTSPDWEPRRHFAGTFGDDWLETRAPQLPADFDPRYYQGAAPGLVSAEYLRGDERVECSGVTPEPTWSFRLPAIPAPAGVMVTRFSADVPFTTRLDTVVVDADERRVTLIWRCPISLQSGPMDVSSVLIDSVVSQEVALP